MGVSIRVLSCSPNPIFWGEGYNFLIRQQLATIAIHKNIPQMKTFYLKYYKSNGSGDEWKRVGSLQDTRYNTLL